MARTGGGQDQVEISAPALRQAEELCRGAEVLPDGQAGLAARIQEAMDAGRPLRAKLGVDPTSTDLHLGHAVVLRRLRKFQDLGHQVVLIIGGFTAQVGDPSGRNATRPPLTPDQVEANARTYLDQIGVILNLASVEITNNADWLARLDLSQVLEMASLVTANQLLAKEAFGSRLERQLPVGFHELFYPLLQAYDSVAVRADVELGGTDQRFNILQGRELQPHYGQKPQLAMLLPLLEGTDGVQKMSKSFNNYIGLTEPPDDMFGKCMRVPDELIVKYLELATAADGTTIDKARRDLCRAGISLVGAAAGKTAKAGTVPTVVPDAVNPKDWKLELARQVVALYHGEGAAEAATGEWQRLHSQRLAPEEMPCHRLPGPQPAFRVLVEAGLAGSSSEGKRFVRDGAVRLDGRQISDPMQTIGSLPAGGAVLQVGRRKFVRLIG